MKKLNLKKMYGSATGPFGFPMRSEIAKAAEQAIKRLSPEVRKHFTTMIGEEEVEGYCRWAKVPSAIDVSESSRTDASLVTTLAIDRDFEVLMPQGADWSQYRKNMIVPFAHIYDALPVGRALSVRRVKNDNPAKNGWLAITKYSEKPEGWTGDWFPDAVWALTKEGTLRGKSVGFVPISVRDPKPDEIKARPELVNVRFVIEKWLVLEYSVAPVQSNPTALVTAIGKGGHRIPEAVQKELGFWLPDDPPSLEDFLEEESQPSSKPQLPQVKSYSPEDLRRKARAAVASVHGEVQEAITDALDLARGRV